MDLECESHTGDVWREGVDTMAITTWLCTTVKTIQNLVCTLHSSCSQRVLHPSCIHEPYRMLWTAVFQDMLALQGWDQG